MKRSPLFFWVVLSIAYLLCACTPINHGTPQEIEISSPNKIKASYGDLMAILQLKENWIGKINTETLGNDLSPDGKLVLVDNALPKHQYYLMSTTSPYETIQMQINPSPYYWYSSIWSQDGKSIAITGGDATRMGPAEQVIVYTVNEEKELISKKITLPNPNINIGIEWSPDGSRFSIIDGDLNKISIFNLKVLLLKEIKLDADFDTIWGKAGLLIGIHNGKNYEMRQYDTATWNYQNLFIIKNFDNYDIADFNSDSSRIIYRLYDGINKKSFRLLLIDLSSTKTKIKDVVFEDIDGELTRYNVKSGNSKWIGILGVSKKEDGGKFYHVYLFNQFSNELIDYGIAEDLIGWYPNANGFLIKREINGKSEVDILTPPTEK